MGIIVGVLCKVSCWTSSESIYRLITYRTERRKVSSNDSGVLGDVLRRRVHGRLGLGRLVLGRLVLGRLRLGRLILGSLGLLVAVFRLLVVVSTFTTGSNCGGKRRGGCHDLNETHICGINEGQEDPRLERLLS